MEFTEIIQKENPYVHFVTKTFSGTNSKDFEAGRMAPTAFNKQPQRIVLLESEEALKKKEWYCHQRNRTV